MTISQWSAKCNLTATSIKTMKTSSWNSGTVNQCWLFLLILASKTCFVCSNFIPFNPSTHPKSTCEKGRINYKQYEISGLESLSINRYSLFSHSVTLLLIRFDRQWDWSGFRAIWSLDLNSESLPLNFEEGLFLIKQHLFWSCICIKKQLYRVGTASCNIATAVFCVYVYGY